VGVGRRRRDLGGLQPRRYLTWRRAPGKTDAERNCISNIRPEGLGYDQAAERIFMLMAAARARRISGIALKEESAIELGADRVNGPLQLRDPIH